MGKLASILMMEPLLLSTLGSALSPPRLPGHMVCREAESAGCCQMERALLKMTESSDWRGSGWQTRTQREGRKETKGTGDVANGNIFWRCGEKRLLSWKEGQEASNEDKLLESLGYSCLLYFATSLCLLYCLSYVFSALAFGSLMSLFKKEYFITATCGKFYS